MPSKYITPNKWAVVLIILFLLSLPMVNAFSHGNVKGNIQSRIIKINLQASLTKYIKNNSILGNSKIPGQPQIPVIKKDVMLPVNAILRSLTYNYSILDKKVKRLSTNLRFGYTPPITFDGKHFYKDKLPLKPVRFITSGAYRNIYKFVKFAYYPLIIKTQNSKIVQITFYGKITLYIRFYVNTNYNSKYENNVYASPIGYAIVTTNKILKNSKELHVYIDFLKYQGYNVYVVTEDEYGYATGQQRAVNIRNWLKNNYIAKNIYYVLLIGNPDPDNPASSTDSYGDIPMMMVWPKVGGSSYYDANKTPTDYFYADLTGNWDLDGDGYYGEWSDDTGPGGVDYTADVYVGRIPVYNNDYTTLDNILSHIMHRSSLKKSILMPMAITNYYNEDHSNEPRTDGRKLPYYIGEFASNYEKVAMYEGAGLRPVSSDAAYYDYNINEQNFIQEWNKGYGYVIWSAHGYKEGAYRKIWYNDYNNDGVPENNENEMEYKELITSYDALYELHTKDTIVFQDSCLNGYPEDSNNLGYTLLQKSLATISATRVSWYVTGTWIPNQDPINSTDIGYYTFKNMIINNYNVGKALYKAKSYLSSNIQDGKGYMNLMDFNLYGAPEIGNAAPPHVVYRINFNVNPSNGGTIKVDGYSYGNDETADIFQGSHTLMAESNSGYVFDHWDVSGDINIVSSNYTSTTLTVYGDGTVTAVFRMLSVPSPPRDLEARVVDGHVVLNWQPPVDDGGSQIIEYRIYRGTDMNSEIYIGKVNGSTFTYTDYSVEEGKTYYYYVIAVNSMGSSPPSNITEVKIKSPVTNSIYLSIFIPFIMLMLISIVTIAIVLMKKRKSSRMRYEYYPPQFVSPPSNYYSRTLLNQYKESQWQDEPPFEEEDDDIF